MINKRLSSLKKLFFRYNIDGYIVPKNDEFFGEYVSPRDDRLKYISNFSGSAGFALILKNKSYLFIDGRYTLQAKIEAGQKFEIIEIHKLKPNYILNKINKKLSLGFDPKLLTENVLIKNFKTKNVNFISINDNLIDKIWKNKSKKKHKKFYFLNKRNTGQDYKKKISKISNFLKRKKVKNLLITAPENIAWLLNIRGYDLKYSPITNCHAIINDEKKIVLIVDKEKIGLNFKKKFGKSIIYINPENFSNFLKTLDKNEIFFTDNLSCSIYYKNEISKNFKYFKISDPIFFLKAKKNKIEIKNMIKSHISDGIALTKFIFWLKKNINKNTITELDAQYKLENFRKENKNYLFPSFNTISGAGPNGAIVHYRATPKTSRVIKKNDIFLCDSGGQYKYGTTDVTRTICFSKPKKNIKKIFTKVLKGHIGVAMFKLNKNTSGKQIDKIARTPLKSEGKDYAHGTGHGVGYFLNVHEGPQSISKHNNIKLEEGMILSNEPGYYEKNKFGIRIENLIYIKKIKNKLKFKNLTLAPIEKDLINYNLLNNKEKKYLKEYHQKVYVTLYPYLNKNERIWLKSFTR